MFLPATLQWSHGALCTAASHWLAMTHKQSALPALCFLGLIHCRFFQNTFLFKAFNHSLFLAGTDRILSSYFLQSVNYGKSKTSNGSEHELPKCRVVSSFLAEFSVLTRVSVISRCFLNLPGVLSPCRE